jgi:hypothetical protein
VDEPIASLPRPTSEKAKVQMASVLQWIGLAFGIGVIAFGVMGFFRGLSLPPNTPEHRAHGKGDNWRT